MGTHLERSKLGSRSQPQLQRATLAQLLERAVPYEWWRAPFDPKLRILTWFAGAALLAHLLFLLTLPWLLEASDSDFFLIFRGTLHGLLFWVADRVPLLLGLNLLALLSYLWLVWRTRGLRASRLEWHWAAFGEVVAGAAGAFPLAASLAIILVNLILWIVIICLGVLFGLLTLWLLGAFFGALLEG